MLGLSTIIHPTSFLTARLGGILRSSRFHWLLGFIFQLWLTWFAMLLALPEMLASITFETWFSVFGLWPNMTFRPQDSAVLIFNAEDGMCPGSFVRLCIYRRRYWPEHCSEVLRAWLYSFCFLPGSLLWDSCNQAEKIVQRLFCE